MIYLASPYSHLDPRRPRVSLPRSLSRDCRFDPRRPRRLLPDRAPPPAGRARAATEWTAWERIDHGFLLRCDEVVVLMLVGWEQSDGVRSELTIAAEVSLPVRYLAPDGADVGPQSIPTFHSSEE